MDELTVSPQEFEAAAAEAQQSSTDEASIVEAGDSQLDSTIDDKDIPNSFWDDDSIKSEVEDEEKPDAEDSDEDGDSDEAEEELSEAGQPGKIKYKANGEEVEITLEEAQKKLALVEGARKAITDRSKLRKQLEQRDKQLEEAAEYKETWDKLDSLKGDKSKLWKAITGESLEDYIEAESERQRLYEMASPEERRAMDAENKLSQYEKESSQQLTAKEQRIAEADEKLFLADKKEMKVQLLQEFNKYEFPTNSPATSNRLRKMVWRDAIADLKDYRKEYGKVNGKMVKKAFSDAHAAITDVFENSVSEKVSEVSAKKKKQAKEKAQIASTRNYKKPIDDELTKLAPDDLFNKFFRR